MPQFTADQLRGKKSQKPQPQDQPYDDGQIKAMLKSLPGWEHVNGEIAKTFSFDDYHQTMAFVNATAWISHREDHHPDLEVGYNRCRIRYSTHDIGGIGLNDFICAAKMESLLEL